jgi:hypothetical protein
MLVPKAEREGDMSETSARVAGLKSIRDQVDDVNEAVILDAAVQAMDLLEKIQAAEPLREAVERRFGEDIWPD